MNRKLLFLAVLVLTSVAQQCSTSSERTAAAEEKVYAGTESCKSCHQDAYQKHLLTPHHLTSQLPDSLTIKGSFEQPSNTFFYAPGVFMVMEKQNHQFFQTLYARNEKIKSKAFDFVVGSGVRGQTYLTWKDSILFQLPIGYFTMVDSWANSPGFSNRPIFNRPITSRCLECHSTYFKKTAGKYPERFSKKNYVLGIDCEKCHGPGLKHVTFHQNNPQAKKGEQIISFKNFTRQQQLDYCRSCHGGKLAATKPAFTFSAGDRLEDFFGVDSAATTATLDSHGNQYGMLSRSKCFLNSSMTCLTCHQVHENERGKTNVFSARCLTCHAESSSTFCSFTKLPAKQLKENCIQCHMPERNSNSIKMLLQGDDVPTPAKMHVHQVAVYPEEIANYIHTIPLSKN